MPSALHAPGAVAARVAAILAVVAVLLISSVAIGVSRSSANVAGPTVAAGAPDGNLNVELSFGPQSITLGSSTQGNLAITGGTAPYFLWFNATPPGCEQSSQPTTTSVVPYMFRCQPTQSGNFGVNVTVRDSATPVDQATNIGNLNVISSNNNQHQNNGSNGSSNSGGNGSLSLPSGLFTFVLIFGAVFLGAMVAIAAGVIATAVLVSRQVRRLNETLAGMSRPPQPPKPPE